ncbi:MAE_28990/MAE_18760 family HEPN-like nuclease [Micromonospora citrea]|uniref:MAE_28990/MAE_18760 family HEPN-like nuclease n=1 Tax=Micromonospora citrea TaxID=47855 RepID=UPI003C4CD233
MQDTLDASFGWRRIEMKTLVDAMESASKKSRESPLARALARSCVAIIYAHWEGFVKESCQCYVDYVAKRRLRFQDLNDGLLKTALMALMRRSNTGDDAGAEALLDVVRRPQEARAHLPKNSMVDTKSNLRYVTLCEILGSAGLPLAYFETKSKLIDRSLCDSRNSIAHGREMFPTADEIVSLHSEVVEMMDHLRALILDASRDQSYRSSLIPQQRGS